MSYQQLAQRTCPESYHLDLVRPEVLEDAMYQAIVALQRLDTIKKAFAYGREMPEHTPLPASEIKGNLDGHILHAILGIATESGELLEAAVKTLFEGVTFDVVNYKEEMGDVGWYRAIGLTTVGQTIEENDTQNIDKLEKRFPEKFFDADRANNRDLAGERAVLEGVEPARATLKEAQYFGDHAYGKIYGDTKGRFPDGTDVHTTAIVSREGNVVTTKSGSIYTIELKVDADAAAVRAANVRAFGSISHVDPDPERRADDEIRLFDAEIFEYGPDHDRVRGKDVLGDMVASGRIDLQPFIAGDEYEGKYRGMMLVTDGVDIYRLVNGYRDTRTPTTTPGSGGGRGSSSGPDNGISRVG